MPTVVSPLPAGSTLGFSYEVGVDIDTSVDPHTVPVWQPIRKITAVAPSVKSITVDTATYDDLGAPSEDKISEGWDLAFTVQANRLATLGAYAPEVEALLAYTLPDANGSAAVAHVRWYDKPAGAGVPNPDDAFEGFCTVSVERGATGNADSGSWNVKLAGKGRRLQIANPADGA